MQLLINWYHKQIPLWIAGELILCLIQWFQQISYKCFVQETCNSKCSYSKYHYRNASNIRCTWSGINIVDHSDVVGASPVGAVPTTSSFSTGFKGFDKNSRKTVRGSFKCWDLVRLKLETWGYTSRSLSGKLWCLQHSCVGATIAYLWTSDGLVQGCSNSSALAMGLQPSCTKHRYLVHPS